LFSRWFFGDPKLADLILPLTIVLVAAIAQVMVYGYYRGCLLMNPANALQLCNVALVPLAAVLLLHRFQSVALVMSAMGLATLSCSGLFAVPIIAQLRTSRTPVSLSHEPGIARRAAELLQYGVRRVPGDFAINALLVSGPVIAAHFAPMPEVTYLLLGLSILSMTELGVGPLSVVLLSKVSQLLAKGRRQEVQVGLQCLLSAIIELSVFGCLQLESCADVVVRIWMGQGFIGGVWIIRIILLSIPFYLTYVVSRSFIDAASENALNGRNYVSSYIAFLLLVAAAIASVPTELLVAGVAAALLIAFLVLACLTLRTAQQLFDLRGTYRECLRPLLCAVALGGLSFLARWVRGSQMGVVELFSLELFLSGLYLAGLIKLRSPWLEFLQSSLIRRTVTITDPILGS
jgi:O-antigen/teichoic acid export membrane protein